MGRIRKDDYGLGYEQGFGDGRADGYAEGYNQAYTELEPRISKLYTEYQQLEARVAVLERKL